MTTPETKARRHAILDERIMAGYTLLQLNIWIGLGLTSVHQKHECTDCGQEYGWIIPIEVAVILFPIVYGAWRWGKAYGLLLSQK